MRSVDPVARISVGLVALTLFLILIAEFAFSVFRDDVELAQRARKTVAEDLAIQASVLIQRGDLDAVQRTFDAIVEREGDILSVGVRNSSDVLLVQTAEHKRHWIPLQNGKSSITRIAVPISTGKGDWGNVEVSFRAPIPTTLPGWVGQPLVLLTLVVVLGGFLVFSWYMRRVLDRLDPARALPDRVRKALDTLTEGVIVIDPTGRIVLANEAFRALHGEERLSYSTVASEIPGLKEALGRPAADHPWRIAMRNGTKVAGEVLEITRVLNDPRKVKLGASPITDARGALRGCLVSFTDVTELDRKNTALEKALSELEVSRRKIATQNEELKQLANIDPLTGCMNRRAFLEAADALIRGARNGLTPVSCVMADLDRFKSFNDDLGHAVGDQVLQQVARVLKAALRPTDLLCRYGGEEFCIILPDLNADHAATVAERMRSRVEEQAGPGLRRRPHLTVTVSLGLSALEFGATTLSALIDEADRALYAAKQAGRNRLIRYDDLPQPRGAAARS